MRRRLLGNGVAILVTSGVEESGSLTTGRCFQDVGAFIGWTALEDSRTKAWDQVDRGYSVSVDLDCTGIHRKPVNIPAFHNDNLIEEAAERKHKAQHA